MAKPTKWPVCPAKTQISLSISPIWSESLLCAWRILGFLAILRMHSKGSDQTVWMLWLTGVFAGHTHHLVGIAMLQLKFKWNLSKQCRSRSNCSFILWTHYYNIMVKLHCSSFKIITASFSSVRFFQILWYIRIYTTICLHIWCLFTTFNNFSVISQRCLVATGSSMLTFIVLPHWSIMPQALDMIPHPVTLSWHWVDQS